MQRKAEMDEQSNSLYIIPKDILLNIGQLLQQHSLRNILNLIETCKKYHLWFSDDSFWARLYSINFGPITIIADPNQKSIEEQHAKIQYSVASLHRHALIIGETRPDIALICYKKIHGILSHYRAMPWTNYYYGMLLIEAWGTKYDYDKGIELLRSRFKQGDYRAAIGLVTYFRGELIDRSDFDTTILAKAYQRGIPQAALALGKFYAFYDEEQAEQWLLKAMKAGIPAAIVPLSKLKVKREAITKPSLILNKRSEIPINQQIRSLVNYLESLVADAPPMIQAEIYYIQGKLLRNKAINSCIEQLNKAITLNHYNALIELGDIYAQWALWGNNKDYRERANKIYKEAYSKKISAKPAQHRFNFATLSEIPPAFKKDFTSGKGHPEIAKLVSRYYLKSSSTPQEAEKIWWIQLAAQCHCENSYKFLRKMEEENASAYAFCALGLIYSFGIFSRTNDRDFPLDLGQANKCFKRANQLDETALELYLDTGIQEGIICNKIKEMKEIKKILQDQISAFELESKEVQLKSMTFFTVSARSIEDKKNELAKFIRSIIHRPGNRTEQLEKLYVLLSKTSKSRDLLEFNEIIETLAQMGEVFFEESIIGNPQAQCH